MHTEASNICAVFPVCVCVWWEEKMGGDGGKKGKYSPLGFTLHWLSKPTKWHAIGFGCATPESCGGERVAESHVQGVSSDCQQRRRKNTLAGCGGNQGCFLTTVTSCFDPHIWNTIAQQQIISHTHETHKRLQPNNFYFGCSNKGQTTCLSAEKRVLTGLFCAKE